MVRFVPMTEAQFAEYMKTAVVEYAEAHLKSGDCEAGEALALAQADYDSLLPRGLSTPSQHLYALHVDGEADPVGMLWFESRERRGKRSAYIYDFNIRPELRGKGHGAAALRALDDMLRGLGVGRVSLNVMGWNTGAKALYERCGYGIAGIGMTKLLA